MRKKIQIGSLFLLVALIAFIGWYRWDLSLDRGYEFGYWGSFNRVSNSLARLPGIFEKMPSASASAPAEPVWLTP